MEFGKKTRTGSLSSITKILIKLILVIFVMIVAIVLVDRIDFPTPIKKIEIIPNENFKIIK